MEYSSPLAAMRPQPHPTWGHRQDLSSLRCGLQTYGGGAAAANFDFKAMSMQPRQPKRTDYFTLRPMRGSSPTASLTADLDANFHIDKSPQAPTPRRSLFTADLFNPRSNNSQGQGQLDTPPIDPAVITTPPIPSSSPFFEPMEISPLPHKLPHFAAQLTLPSPTPEETPSPDIDLISPDLLSPPVGSLPAASTASTVQPAAFLQFPERRRPVSRPGLTRTKGLSFGSMPHRTTSSETQLPPFRFGNVSSASSSGSSTPILLDTFTESPVEDMRPASAASMPPPPRRPSISCLGRANGSPSANHIRKPSAGRSSFVRPQRKLMRRSLSMFQHPDDVMKEEQQAFDVQPAPCLGSVMDVERESSPKLPHFVPEQEHDSLPRITQETMLDVLDSKYSHQYDRLLVIDCRFEYEYLGGHIDTALNFNDMHQLTDHLFGEGVPPNTLLILHCEFSVHRAPRAARFIRSHDRNVNAANYPHLTYPELYILDGGYSKFFSNHPAKCFPQNYVEMNDHRHELDCERGMAKVKQQRQRLFRNQTFAFGQNNVDDMEDSPTALGRNQMARRNHSAFDVGANISDGIGQSFQRRMASY